MDSTPLSVSVTYNREKYILNVSDPESGTTRNDTRIWTIAYPHKLNTSAMPWNIPKV